LTSAHLIDRRSHLPPRRRLVAVAVLIGLGLSFHLPRIDRPFGGSDQNPGIYDATYARNYERLGLRETRGSQLGRYLLTDVSQGAVDVRHPPGVPLLYYAIGTAEWQVRLVTVVGSIVAAILLYLILTASFCHGASLFGAAVFLLSPNVALHSQASVEDILIPTGLALFLALRLAAAGGKVAPRAVVIAATAIGPWIDWGFAFFCLACVPICWAGTVAGTLRRLALPATVSILSLVSVLAWRAWASGALGLVVPANDMDVGQLFATYVLERPPFLDFVSSRANLATASMTWTLVVLLVLGILPLWRRDPKLATALTLTGLLTITAFATHGDWAYYTNLVPLVAASAAALFAAVRWIPERVRLVVGVAVVAIVAVSSWRVTTATSTTLYADAGRIMSAASRGANGESYMVVHNLGLHYYGYYVDSKDVVFRGFADPVLLDTERKKPSEQGLRFLWARGAVLPSRPGLAKFLRQFPMRRLPELEVTFVSWGLEIAIDEAWMVTLRNPPQ
jgi:hypothetical protein